MNPKSLGVEIFIYFKFYMSFYRDFVPSYYEGTLFSNENQQWKCHPPSLF